MSLDYRICEVKDFRYPNGIARCVFHGWTGGENPQAICEYIDGTIKFVNPHHIRMTDIGISLYTKTMYSRDPVTGEVIKYGSTVCSILQEREEDKTETLSDDGT